MKKSQDFFSYVSILLLTLCLIPSILGFLLGVFVTSSIDAKYMTALIGAFAGTLALIGVIYSKNKEQKLKEIEIEHNNQRIYKEQKIKTISYIFTSINYLRQCLILQGNIIHFLHDSESQHSKYTKHVDFSMLLKHFESYDEKMYNHLIEANAIQETHQFFNAKLFNDIVINPLYRIRENLGNINQIIEDQESVLRQLSLRVEEVHNKFESFLHEYQKNQII